MANFREHIAVSSLLGVGYGVAATTLLEFTPAEAALGGFLCGVGGMLPDLDLPTGRPGQEIFAMTAAVAPLVLIGHVLQWTGLPATTETVMLLILVMYFSVRYGLAWLVNAFSVHRGMFHSLPAMVIAAEVTYLLYPGRTDWIRLLMGGGIALGFFSHLLLDELYSITWAGPLPQFKKSFGTAIKFFGKTIGPTVATYGLLVALTFIIGEQTGIIGPPVDPNAAPMAEEDAEQTTETIESAPAPIVHEAAAPAGTLTDAPLYR